MLNFFSPIPSISFNLSILLSRICKVSLPNAFTIFLAVTGPIPCIIPVLKYFSISFDDEGNFSLYSFILNCLPNCLCWINVPLTSICCPSCSRGITPTIVISSLLAVIFATVYPVSSLLNIIASTEPSNTSDSIYISNPSKVLSCNYIIIS